MEPDRPQVLRLRDLSGIQSVHFRPSLFQSFFLGGFECSTHRNMAGCRLDLIAATRHDLLAREDYAQLAECGLLSARDGVRWHLVEAGAPGRYDWSSTLPLLHAAEAAGVQVIWDLFHYGWPDGLDIFSAGFVDRLARYAAAFARLHLAETGRAPFVCPVNEISFLAWAGGDMARMGPHARGRGAELKQQLVRAAIAATIAVRDAVPGTRVATVDPIIHIVPHAGQDPGPVEAYNEAQWQGWDMLTGRLDPGLGGSPDMLDVMGVNYYWNNQWLDNGEPLSPFDGRYRPLHDLLAAAQARYGKPFFLAETSIEGPPRADWLAYVSEEVRRAIRIGVPVEGICLYPILGHMGWDEDRYCDNGLFGAGPSLHGRRPVHAPLLVELHRQQALFTEFFAGSAPAPSLLSDQAITPGLPDRPGSSHDSEVNGRIPWQGHGAP